MDNQTILSIQDLRVVFEDGFTALGVSIDIGERVCDAARPHRLRQDDAALRCIGGFERTSGGNPIRGRTSSACRRISARSTPCFQRYALFLRI